jgi:hypothetical protein
MQANRIFYVQSDLAELLDVAVDKFSIPKGMAYAGAATDHGKQLLAVCSRTLDRMESLLIELKQLPECPPDYPVADNVRTRVANGRQELTDHETKLQNYLAGR